MFSHKIPTEIISGRHVARDIPKKIIEYGGKRVFIVSDKGVQKAGVLNEIEEVLKTHQLPYLIYSDIQSDPRINSIDEASKALKEFEADIVVGVGGGSSMDSAKVVAGLATNGGKALDYEGFGKMSQNSLPIIAVPTTAGTGSEVTYWAVLTDESRGTKINVGGWQIYPDVAVVDPMLSLSLPPRITAATGMDALCHAIEAYVAKSANPISEALSWKALTMIIPWLRKAVTRGNDIEARENMAIGSTIAAMSFNLTRLGLSHALALPLGGHFHIPHGEVNAITLPHVMQYNLPAAPEKYSAIAKLFGETTENLPPVEAACKAVNAVKKLSIDIGLVEGLAWWKVTEDDLDMLAQEAITSGNIAVNPRISDTDALKLIMRNAMNGPLT